MKSVDKDISNSIEIKRSKFISFVYFVEREEDVKQYLKALQDKYADATHICYAYILESPNKEKFFDDGEPDGTAGKPMLQVIKRRGLTNVLVAVVRYFGGVKLGAGGLTRAYANSVTEVLDAAGESEYAYAYYYHTEVELKEAKKVISNINSAGGVVMSIEYGQNAHIDYYIFDDNGNYQYKKLTKRVRT